MTDKIVVLSTCPNPAEAAALARLLVEKHLAACVNIVPGVRSVYRWKDVIEDSEEVLLVIKSRRESFEMLQNELSGMHSYEVPEVLALSVVAGSPGYLHWLDRELAS